MKERKGIIYKAISPSGKVYVGKTLENLSRRIQKHKNAAKKIFSNKFYKAYRKYGDSFVWEIIYKDISENLLDVAEMCSIYVLDSDLKGYNSTAGGDGGLMNVHRPEKVKKKISKNNAKYWLGKKRKDISGIKN